MMMGDEVRPTYTPISGYWAKISKKSRMGEELIELAEEVRNVIIDTEVAGRSSRDMRPGYFWLGNSLDPSTACGCRSCTVAKHQLREAGPHR
jgi:N6-adenosine-specific RNA methylase IME4